MTGSADTPPTEGATRSRIDLRTMALVGLLVLFVLFTLRAARAFLVPLAVALLLDFLLSPVIRNLKRMKVPEALGAALVVFGLVGIAVVFLYTLTGPAVKWLDRAPTSMAVVETKLKKLLRPLEKIQETAAAVEEVTSAPNKDGDKSVQIASPTLFQRVSGGTAAFLSTAVTVIFLTYFLLASGDLFMQKIVAILPVLSDKKKAVGISREIEAHISRYLSTSTVINVGMGLITWLALALAGMPNAGLWGFVAGVLNYVPYIGAIVTTAVIGIAALLSFESTTKALLMPGIYFGLNMIESNLVTPLILGRHMPLNPVALFVGLLLWWYLWGIPGAILAVPMMVSLKIFCDYIDGLRPVGTFLGP